AVLFGGGLRALGLLLPVTAAKKTLLPLGWALVTSLAFSAWHYIGPLGDPFEAQPLLFRWVCGLVFVAIYALRGFAAAVRPPAVYDLWLMVFYLPPNDVARRFAAAEGIHRKARKREGLFGWFDFVRS